MVVSFRYVCIYVMEPLAELESVFPQYERGVIAFILKGQLADRLGTAPNPPEGTISLAGCPGASPVVRSLFGSPGRN